MRREIPVTYLRGETFQMRPVVKQPLISRRIMRLEAVMIAHLSRDRFQQQYFPGTLTLTLNRMVL